ncbi:MAG: 3'-5' exonuclease [Rikenellaceae bacterium]
MSTDFLSQLNDVQRSAAANYNGAALIIAGAGSGKTRVLTFRIAHMIREGVAPYSILALTFTNKAAKEMRERISKVVDEDKASKLWMGTFHSIFARILRKEAEHLGFSSNFTIYDSTDSQSVIKNIIKEKNLSDEKYKPRFISSRISLAKNNLVTPAAYSSMSTYLAEDRELGIEQFSDVYREYMMRCKANNAMDFDDLLLYTNLLFRDFPQVLEIYQNKFKYILVDEYQDTNVAQYLIIKKIAQSHGNIAVVGDDSQSIYSFRGAKIENILKFQKDYPSSALYKLEQNYRSTQTIVNAANSVIANNSNRLKKESFSAGEVGEKIKVYKLYTDKEEAINVANDISTGVKKDGKNYNDFAILYRTNAQSRTFEEALRQRNIPYKIYGGFSFYQRAEIKNLIAYARVIVNGNDTEALSRIINFPARGIGNTSTVRISDYARENGLTMLDTVFKIADGSLAIKGIVQSKIAQFSQVMNHLISTAQQKDAYETMFEICYAAGIIRLYKETKSVENQSALQNVEELLNSLKQISDQRAKEGDEPLSISEWLESVVLITSDTQEEEDGEKVTLMTVHSAKGLEFERVFIVGLEEGLFPLEGSVGSLAELEEERRLFYVAITRAVNRLTISLCQNRYKWGRSVNSNPSRFLKEIKSEYLDIDDCEDEYTGVVSRAFSSEKSEKSSYGGYDSSKTNNSSNYSNSGGYRGSNSTNSRQNYSNSSSQRETQPKVTPPSFDTSRFKKVSTSTATSSQTASQNMVSKIKVGDRVEHGNFGIGVVTNLQPTSTDVKATVDFEKSGTRTLLLKFAKLKQI